ncbi:hypothetical protein QUB63_02895 [Microcoleus sp. ARI1-B5]
MELGIGNWELGIGNWELVRQLASTEEKVENRYRCFLPLPDS